MWFFHTVSQLEDKTEQLEALQEQQSKLESRIANLCAENKTLERKVSEMTTAAEGSTTEIAQLNDEVIAFK